MRVFIAVIFAAIAGCATQPSTPPGEAQALWQQRQARSYSLDDWTLDGRLGVRLNNEGWSAGLLWEQSGTAYGIEVLGPLGRKAAQLRGDETGVNLITAKNESYSAQDAEQLMRSLLGWGLPLNGLRYWVLGVPDPGDADFTHTLDDYGRLAVLQQAGWVIDYDTYHQVPDLPRKLSLSSQGVRLKLVVKSWEVRE